MTEENEKVVEEAKETEEVSNEYYSIYEDAIKEEKEREFEDIDIKSVELNFDELRAWRNKDADDLPICSILTVYEVTGLTEAIEKYCEGGKQIVALDNLFCSANTLMDLRDFVLENWQTYSLKLDGDMSISWDTSKYAKNEKHYAKTLPAKVERSVFMDFKKYCPGLDDDLDDGVIVFRVREKKNKEEDKLVDVVEEKGAENKDAE